MPEPDLFLLFVRPLNRMGIRYVVTGSVAAIFYGEPRLTHDVDFVVFLKEAEIELLAKSFPPADFYVPPPEAISAETRREQGGHFNIIHIQTGFKADVYLTGRDELNAWAFKLRHQIGFEGETVALAPPEYVIVRKLEYYREGGSEKHLRDIRSMLAISGDQFDRTALNDWIQQRGLQAEWQLASKNPGEPGP
jgi:hypothetical protein